MGQTYEFFERRKKFWAGIELCGLMIAIISLVGGFIAGNLQLSLLTFITGFVIIMAGQNEWNDCQFEEIKLLLK
jgi:hypothetical protein